MFEIEYIGILYIFTSGQYEYFDGLSDELF